MSTSRTRARSRPTHAKGSAIRIPARRPRQLLLCLVAASAIALTLGACSSASSPGTPILEVLPVESDAMAVLGDDAQLDIAPRVWVVPTDFAEPKSGTRDSECQDSLNANNAREQAAETAIVTYREPGDNPGGAEAEWKVGRYDGSDAAGKAADMVAAIGDMYTVCADEAKTDSSATQMELLDSSIADTVGYALADNGRRVLVTSSGPYVLTVTAGKSAERADEMLQLQLDRIAALSSK